MQTMLQELYDSITKTKKKDGQCFCMYKDFLDKNQIVTAVD